jgi:hypothetical protein
MMAMHIHCLIRLHAPSAITACLTWINVPIAILLFDYEPRLAAWGAVFSCK